MSDRFWTKVDKSAGPGACWPWLGAIDSTGYGAVKRGGRKTGAHRVACALAHGPAPEASSCALHACDRPACCNPAHLRWGSKRQNAGDATERGRWNPCRGERSRQARLTDGAVRELRAADGSLRALAARFGVAATTVRAVRSGRTWRHVA